MTHCPRPNNTIYPVVYVRVCLYSDYARRPKLKAKVDKYAYMYLARVLIIIFLPMTRCPGNTIYPVAYVRVCLHSLIFPVV